MYMEMAKIKDFLLKTVDNYQNYIKKSSLDLPLECLCLSKQTLNLLRKHGFRRVFELSATDLTKIKGLGDDRLREIADRMAVFDVM